MRAHFLLTLFVAVATCGAANAAATGVVPNGSDSVVVASYDKHEPSGRVRMPQPRWDVRIGYGVIPLRNLIDKTGFVGSALTSTPNTQYGPIDITDQIYHGTPSIKWCDTGVIYIAGSYALNRHIELGGEFAFSRYWSQSPESTFAQDYYSVRALIRVAYLRREWFCVYGSAAVGVQILQRQRGNIRTAHILPDGQLSLLGISVGKQFHAFIELGVGNTGFVCGGIGYRF